MSEDVGEVGFYIFALTFVGKVKSGNCQIRFEWLIGWIVKGMVGCVIPKSGVLIAIMGE